MFDHSTHDDTQMTRKHLGFAGFVLLTYVTLYIAARELRAGSGYSMRDSMIIVEMKKHFQLRAIEWWSAGVMASWGVWVLLFPTIFADNPAFDMMAQILPQRVWGLIALGAGAVRLVALFVNGLWYRTPAVRWACAMLSILIWFIMTAAFVGSSVANLGAVIYGWHMLADMYSAFRSASDFIEAEAQRQIKKLSVAPVAGGASNVRSLPARRG